MRSLNGKLTIIDPEEISKESIRIKSLADYGLDHLNSSPLLGWNYILDHVWIANEIEAYLKNFENRKGDLTILDIGCGNSKFHNYLEDRYKINIFGIDRPYGYCHLSELSNVDYHCDFLEVDIFGENSVDIVYWLSSIEHNNLRTMKKLVQKSFSLLKKGGQFLATMALSEKTDWFEESQQTNLSIPDCIDVFSVSEVEGQFDTIRESYRRNTLFLKDKYKNRYHRFENEDPKFIVGAIKKVNDESNDLVEIEPPCYQSDIYQKIKHAKKYSSEKIDIGHISSQYKSNCKPIDEPLNTEKHIFPKRIRQQKYYQSDFVEYLANLRVSENHQLPLLWETFLKKYLPATDEGKNNHQFLEEKLSTSLKACGEIISIYLISSGIIKFYLPSCSFNEQKKWLNRFNFLLMAIKEKLLAIKPEKLEVYEQFFLTSYRYLISHQFLNNNCLTKQGELFLMGVHSFLVAIQVWKLGCMDEKDVKIIEKIIKSNSSVNTSTLITSDQFFSLFALMLFRKSSRVTYQIDSNRIFSSYIDQIKSLNPKHKNNVYLCRLFVNQNSAEEYALWYLENYEEISNYRNIHKGESCFIIGNGPSLRKMDLSLLRNRKTIGLNKIYMLFDKLGFETTYLAAANPYVIQQSAKEFHSLSLQLFVMMWGREFIQKKDNVIFLRENSRPFFAKEITNGVCIDATVTYMALQIAYYMGFKTVFLIGVDHSFESKGTAHTTVRLKGDDPNHFDPNYFGHGVPWQLPDIEGSERAYQRAKNVYEADGRRILDATVDGKLQVFEKISYKEALDLTAR